MAFSRHASLSMKLLERTMIPTAALTHTSARVFQRAYPSEVTNGKQNMLQNISWELQLLDWAKISTSAPK